MGEIASKLQDALSMFWQSLDQHERRMMLYAVAYFACSLLLAAHKRSRERLKVELREEIARGVC